ncbi:hypothetical protein RN001_010216 [Aquatica leii]|uniref:Epoxide hydrolase n=1 Tax=Aquatica leii TaxID=1421715 RepID=A0AAN7SQ81_9COLE|nr:hypothetical protein RN001_010216 [Aquatica leii]
MAFFRKVFYLIIAATIVFVGVKINYLLEPPPIPNLENEYWGPGSPTKDDTAIRPFKINVPEQVLEVLKTKLNQPHTLISPLEGIQQQYGMNTNLLKKIVEFWKTKYDWRKREQYLNKYPQFQTKIQGLTIHFLHVKPTVTEGKEVVPLLLLHGWPGSVREFYELIPLLTTPRKDQNFVFEVVVPSLPGYGFSEASAKPGLGPIEIGAIFKNLMKRLGLNKFYIQGGDWGAHIGRCMAAFYPEHVLGLHSNMCMSQTPMSQLKLIIGAFYPPLVVDEKFQHRMYPLGSIFANTLLETGYMHIQSTKPDTIGVALGDSPIGLAAYILEKFTSWTNPEWKNREDGGLNIKFKYEDLLDNVMIYWVTGSITTSMRLYSETINKRNVGSRYELIPVEVPSACARFAYELLYFSDTILKHTFKQLVQTNDIPRGGHFAAFEEPQLMADDVWPAVQKFRQVHKQQISH